MAIAGNLGMKSMRAGMIPVIAAALSTGVAALAQPAEQAPFTQAQPRAAYQSPASLEPQAPSYIRDRVRALGAAFNGRIGIAVRSVDDGLW